MKNLLLFACLSLISYQAFAQNNMFIIDPQNPWWDAPAAIENLDFTVKPIGTHAEVAMYFDVAKGDDGFGELGQQLEFHMYFSMPDGVVFNDSWLYIDDYISKGVIYEAGIGTEIYEGIVNRQQDPSILSKYSNNQYSLKIYPLFADSTRRVKLSYLTPMKFDERRATVDLPIELFYQSSRVIENMSVTVLNDNLWQPKEVNSEFLIPTSTTSSSVRYELMPNGELEPLRIEYSLSNDEKPYVMNSYKGEDDKYFQLLYFPQLELDEMPRYNMVILDHSAFNTTADYDQEFLLSTLKNTLLNRLDESDHFNITYADFGVNILSDTWSTASEENIAAAIATIDAAGIDQTAKLSSLLPEALKLISKQDQAVEITIVSASTEFSNLESAEEFNSTIHSYIEEMGLNVSFNILNYANRNVSTQYIGNQPYTGNQYFYSLLTAEAANNYLQAESSFVFQQRLTELYTNLLIPIGEYDFNIDLNNGFTYSVYTNADGNNKLDVNQPITALGKYIGDAPFELTLDAIYDDQYIINEETIAETSTLSSPEMVSRLWHSSYILDHEFETDFDTRQDVIDVSKAERLLSFRTVFLCLEENFDTISVSTDDEPVVPEDGDVFVATDDLITSQDKIFATPNPFVDRLSITLADQIDLTEPFTLQVYDLRGQLISSSIVATEVLDGAMTIDWQSPENLASGVYIIKLSNGMSQYVVRVVKI